MADLHISLLGSVQITRCGEPVTAPAYDKARALLALLLMNRGRPHRRETLAELLWPDQPEGRGRHSLRQALVTLRQMTGGHDHNPSILLTTRATVQVHPDADYDLDVESFTAHLDAVSTCRCNLDPACDECVHHLSAAIDEYRGDFMAGFSIDAGEEFDTWLLGIRERLRLDVLAAARDLADHHLTAGAYPQAIGYARFQVGIDPAREVAHRQLMTALYFNGDQSAALAQFDACAGILAGDLEVEPEDDTLALRDAIRHRTLVPRRDNSPVIGLPAQATPFIGREQELAEIAALLETPGCRLLTIAGPGGAGKSRLAIEAARAAAPSFPDGVVLVPLAGLHTTGSLIQALADALFPSSGYAPDLSGALRAFLRERELLLVLDNFEHLVNTSGTVSTLLAEAPGVRALVTSRVRLDLYEERVIDLGGLALPSPDDLEQSAAVRLFIDGARRTSSAFAPGPDDRAHIARICALVGGMPLALELAAASTIVLSCAEIAAEVEASIDFLSTSYRNIPDRHRSMKAVFDQTWELLTSAERDVFSRLSIFRGGFDRAAAEHVAGATLSSLASLAGKSLVRRVAGDRYEIHELLRQYGEARLWSVPDGYDVTIDRHSRHFCSLLAMQEPLLGGETQREAIEALTLEIENLRMAWKRAIDTGNVERIAQASHGLWIFMEVTSRYVLAESIFGMAVDLLRRKASETPHSVRVQEALASALVRYGSMFCRLGDLDRGEAAVREGCEIARAVDAPNVLGLGLNFMAVFATEREDHQTARQHLQASVSAFRQAGDRWGEAYSTSDLAMTAFRLGEVIEAQQLQEDALAMFSEIGDKRGLAFALHDRGVMAIRQGEFREARAALHKALDIRRSLHHAWAESMTLTQLGIVAAATGNMSEARSTLIQALRQAQEIHSLPAMLTALTEIARIIVRPVSEESAWKLLTSIQRHPSTDPRLAARVTKLLAGMNAPATSGDDSPTWTIAIEDISSQLLTHTVGANCIRPD